MFLHRRHTSRWSSSRPVKLVLLLGLLFGASVLPFHSQKGTQSSPQPPQTLPPPDPILDYGPPREHVPTFEDLQFRKYLASQLKSMVSDADKLLKLAQDLNKDADPPAGSSPSRDDVRRVAEIEKLAHNVKWKMQLVAGGSEKH